MKINYWQNPKDKDDERIYVNGIYPYQAGVILPKFFLKKIAGIVCIQASMEFDLERAFMDMRVKLKEEFGIDDAAPLNWGELVSLSKE